MKPLGSSTKNSAKPQAPQTRARKRWATGPLKTRASGLLYAKAETGTAERLSTFETTGASGRISADPHFGHVTSIGSHQPPNAKAQRTRPRTGGHGKQRQRGPWPGSPAAS